MLIPRRAGELDQHGLKTATEGLRQRGRQLRGTRADLIQHLNRGV